jgi:S1-C subfamily serine protease
MKFYNDLPAILAGTAITTALVITQPLTALALTGDQINDIAYEVTVLIIGKQGHGSGVIISQNGGTYYVLTAAHVITDGKGNPLNDYAIVTADKKAYQPDYNNVRLLPGVDLVVIPFTSDKTYQVAKLANSDLGKMGMPVFVSGWPGLGSVGEKAGGQLVRQFTGGQITGLLPQPFRGYQMSYDNVTRAGMSGGPVFDAGGRVIGIHGLGDREVPENLMGQGISQERAQEIADQIKTGFNYAIPINTFLALAPQQGVYLALQVENTAAPALGSPPVAVAPPQERDRIDDVNKVLKTIGGGMDIICRFVPFC